MNRIIIKICIVTLLAVTLLSCKEDYEEVFKETPDQRIQKTLDEYNQLLLEASYGWKAMLYTGSGAGYFYYFNFNEDGRVQMLSDFNEETAGESMEGSWKLKALQRPTLSFDTYSYVHLPADPDGAQNGGTNGEGLVSDFEFALEKTVGDSILFEGIQRGTELIFIKINEEEASAIRGGKIADILVKTKDYAPDKKVFRLLLPNEEIIPMAVDIEHKVFGMQYLDDAGDSVVMEQTPFTFSVNGILLKSAIAVKGFTLKELIWDDEKTLYYAAFGNDKSEFISSSEPFIFSIAPGLDQLIGKNYVGMQIPEGSGTNPLEGQSPAFIEAYNTAAQNMLSGLYNLTLREMNFVYNASENSMHFEVIVSQQLNGVVTRFLAQYTYSYTVNEEGVLDYTFMGANENGWELSYDMEAILNHLDKDTFQLEYVGGVFYLLCAQFSRESQDFYFSGYLLQ